MITYDFQKDLYFKKRKLNNRKKDLENLYKNNIIEWFKTIKQRQHQKMIYLYKNVRYYLTMSKHAYFITLTLNNEYVNLQKQTLIRYIKQQLNDIQPNKWILNDDYGDKNGRIHFHVLIFTEYDLLYTNQVKRQKQHYNLLSWDKYGYSQIKSINVPNINEQDFEKTTKRISKYIVKLTRHAIKGTTVKLWYSRNKKDLQKNNKYLI